jgi:hypothetical protein
MAEILRLWKLHMTIIFHFFSQYWQFMTLPYPPTDYPLYSQQQKKGFKALWLWCFSPSFPCTSGAAPVTQPGTTRIRNSGPKYRTFFSCIYDFFNSFADTKSELSAHWNGHVPRTKYNNNRTAKFHFYLLKIGHVYALIFYFLFFQMAIWEILHSASFKIRANHF